MYDIRSYNEVYLPKQVEIGKKIIDKWPGTNQTSVDGLKKRYSMDDFDPDLKLYAFHKDEMVGFQTSTIKKKKEGETIFRANCEFPIVIEGHEAVVDLLIQESHKRLKAKGVTLIQARVSKSWGNTVEYAKKYDFTLKRVISKKAELNIENYTVGTLDSHVVRFNKRRDKRKIKRMYLEKMGMPKEQFERQIIFLNANPQIILCWNMWKEQNYILGNSICISDAEVNSAICANIFAYGENESMIRKAILEKNIYDLKEREIEILSLNLTTDYLDKEAEYTKLGFVFVSELALYKKEL